MIARIPNTTSADDFVRNYFDPECPVVVTDVTDGWPAAHQWSLRHLTERFADQPGLERANWFEMDDRTLGDDCEQPSIVAACLDPKLSTSRTNNVRVWLHRRGNTTNLHHDGNLLFVFNIQVKGKKRWRLISPHSDVRYNFLSRVPDWSLHTATVDEIQDRGIEVLEFELNEGEMLFVPPLWAHQVTSLDNENVNLNWVATRRTLTPSHRLRREQEVLGAIERLTRFRPTEVLMNRLLAGSAKGYLEHFGGVGTELVDHLTQRVTGRAAARRIVCELPTIPRSVAFKLRRRSDGTPVPEPIDN